VQCVHIQHIAENTSWSAALFNSKTVCNVYAVKNSIHCVNAYIASLR